MTNEEILKPRYKVIADYPQSKFEINEILIPDRLDGTVNGFWVSECKNNRKIVFATPQNYPHLFKKLEWWEEREERDMPEYVRFIRNYHNAKRGEIKKVVRYAGPGFYTGETESYLLSNKDILPATKEEYEAQNLNRVDG